MYVSHLGDPGGRPVLLLHGGGVAGWMWDPLVEHLDSGPHLPMPHLLVPDLPGHDRSADQPYRSHDETVRDLISFLENEVNGTADVVGFSLGGQLAVLLAARRPDLVDRIVVVSAQAVASRSPTAILALLRAAAPLMRSERFARVQARQLLIPDPLIDAYLRTSRRLSAGSLLAFVEDNIRFSVPEEWSDHRGEVLILVGGSERSMMKRSAQLLARGHRGGRVEVVDGCGHGIPLQAPSWLARRLRRWLFLR